MARFPDSPRPFAPISGGFDRPVSSGGPRWRPQGRNLTRFNLLAVDLGYRMLTWATGISTLYAFWESVGGAAGVFSFADFNGIENSSQGIAWPGLFVAKGDTVTVTWTLPTFSIKSSPAPVVSENGVAKTTHVWESPEALTVAAGNYLIVPGAGVDGGDSLIAGTAPGLGVLVTISATCRRFARYAKFTGERFPFGLDDPAVMQAGTLSIIEVVG